MNIQEKIAREEAKLFLEEYSVIHKWEPLKVDIFKKTALYKFYVNDRKAPRDKESASLLFPKEMNRLVKAQLMTEAQVEEFNLMMASGNDGDFIIVSHAINLLRNKRLKLKKKSEQTTR